MRIRTILIMIFGMLILSTNAFAGFIDWSTSDVTPVDADTIRAYGLRLTGDTSGTSYNVDFLFNETTLNFEPVLPSSAVVNNEANLTSADAVRGGLLYDKWWTINGQAEPTTTHPAYPSTGQQSGSTTWRCKECHGWDYKGKDGAYSSGSHFTAIKGVYDARNLNGAHIFALITSHNIPLSEQDIWDLTRFIKENLVDMNKYIIFTGAQRKSATGDATNGQSLYENIGAGGGMCTMCHGADGRTIDFHEGEGVGDVAGDNPWETLHKIRYGHPGSSPMMPSAVQNGLSIDNQIDILTHAQTLPTVSP